MGVSGEMGRWGGGRWKVEEMEGGELRASALTSRLWCLKVACSRIVRRSKSLSRLSREPLSTWLPAGCQRSTVTVFLCG